MNEQLEKDIKRIKSISGSKPVEQTSKKNPIDEGNFPKILGDLHKHGIDVRELIPQKEQALSNPSQEKLKTTHPKTEKGPAEESIEDNKPKESDDDWLSNEEIKKYLDMAEEEPGYVIDPNKKFTPNKKSSKQEILEAMRHLKSNPQIRKIDD